MIERDRMIKKISLPANQVIASCSSTNDLIKELGENGYSHGTWISARVQDAGRGRLGRVWESREGNLFLSVLLRPGSDRWLSWVPLAVAVAVARALETQFPELESKIKWPNDLWLGSRKFAGILCESRIAGEAANSFVAVGIGVNCVSAPEGAVSLSEKLGRDVFADEIRMPVLKRVIAAVDQLFASGPEIVKTEYNKKALFKSGLEVQWDGGSGRVVGLGACGELLVSLGQNVKGIFAEDVSMTRLKSRANI